MARRQAILTGHRAAGQPTASPRVPPTMPLPRRTLALAGLLAGALVACGPPPRDQPEPPQVDAPTAAPPASADADPRAQATLPSQAQAALPSQAQAAPHAAPAPPIAEVVMIPLGDFPDELLTAIEATLADALPVQVRRGPPRPLSRAAYYPPRRRYRADRLLDELSELAATLGPGVRVLGLTEVDISTTKEPHADWGIFGLAYMPGRAAVVSSHRLRKRAKGPAHVARRVANTAVHEIGHSLGLDHCAEPRCPMQDAEGSIANTDSSDPHLGPECAAELAAILAAPRPLE